MDRYPGTTIDELDKGFINWYCKVEEGFAMFTLLRSTENAAVVVPDASSACILDQEEIEREATPNTRNTTVKSIDKPDRHTIKYDIESFPIFDDPGVYEKYKKEQTTTVKILGLPLLCISYVATVTATRANLMFADYNYLFGLAHFFYAIGLVVSIGYMTSQIVKQSFPIGAVVSTRWAHYLKISKYFLEKSFFGRCDDVVAFSIVLCTVLVLHARISNGACVNQNIWYSQTCNPVASSHSIPQDQLLLIYAWPLFAKTYLRGFTLFSLILSYVICTVGVALAVYRVGGTDEVYSVLYGIVYAIIAVEIERRQRYTFLLHEEVTDRKLTELERNHQSMIAELGRDASNEKILGEMERAQLKSLMANVAHDLKTPLHSIVADLDTLKLLLIKEETVRRQHATSENEEDGDVEGTIGLVESIDIACKFMTMAIHRSQDYMKASSNLALLPSLGSFDISEAVQMAFTCVNNLNSGRTIKVHPLPEGLCSYVISDRHWLVENLMCLLSNAVKYSERGSHVDIRVELVGRSELVPASTAGSPKSAADADTLQRPMLAFYIEDTGNGIGIATRESLFQPFQQAQRLTGGTGLGLYALAKRLEALNGLYGVATRTDGRQGSKFWFSFPYRPDETTAKYMRMSMNMDSPMRGDVQPSRNVPQKNDQLTLAIPPLTTTPRVSSTPSTKRPALTPLRVLLTDDTMSVLKITGQMLRRAGHTVEVAENGSQSLSLLKQRYDGTECFELLLTDLQMPVMDGIESVKRFREFEDQRAADDLAAGRPVKKKLLIVGMSANDDAEIREEAMRAGMNTWLTKPFVGDDFDRSVMLLQVRERPLSESL